MTMEPESSSPPRVTPEQDPVPLPTEGPEYRVTMDQDLVERFMSKVTENALGILDFSHQWEEYEKKMELVEESVRKQAIELQKKEKDSDLKHEELKRELQLKKEELEARQKELSLRDETIQEKSNELKKKEEEFQLKQEAEARDIEVKSKSLELKEKKLEELTRELEVRKQELEASQKELSLLDKTIKYKSAELERRDEQFQLKMNSLELKKILEEIEEVLERKEKELDERSKQAETSKRSRDEFEPSLLAEKDRDEDSLIHPGKKHKPIREPNHDDNEKETDSDCGLYGKTSSDPTSATASQAKGREVYEAVCIDDGSNGSDPASATASQAVGREVDEAICIDDGSNGSNPAPATASQAVGREVDESVCIDDGSDGSNPAPATASQANAREVNEVVCIDDESDEDPEPYNCPDPDFNDFNNTMSSFAVGQVWALYDPLDHMPRCYAQIRKLLKLQMKVEVTWLESKHTTEIEKPIPIACGAFKYGAKTTNSHLMFSHKMHPIKSNRSVIIINPRKGETWALFRDWTPTWNSHKRPYRYDFVQVVSELDSSHGIGVAYLGRVEGFTSVYKLAVQHGILQTMIPSEEMLRFSHRVPSFRLTGDERIGVPAGSFELDPAAIPRDCLEASKVKEEES